ncbi:hypothetical protein HEQ62_09725 [Haematospirillum jordaniae]|nr:AzlC family ABC transporter permease [Haematospirillum jordaniae]NKD45942.1 hypothetical protein [Haematospirillum jordaniae]NKD58020.1 hypothetical protein [Haematospirillum jordaniae]NKD60048.1 hypothetical protein [Haematospirillum jordaniae]NKD68017.1 hypothetical protein [Haematospirillum jordaniae]NKD80110.1 hypothetical protein [Haematospirillum jordaniae]
MGRRNTSLHIPQTMTEYDHALVRGGRSSLPIVVGYLPVAMAFGTAGTAAGLEPVITTSISALIFAGASQFLILAALTSGASVALVIALCTALNARHLLYGSILAPRIPARHRTHMLLAFGLTDEVFATAVSGSRHIGAELRSRWLAGVTLGSYAAWVSGTAAGAFLGTALESLAPSVAEAMGFALPALFLAITVLNVSRNSVGPMMISAVIAGTAAWLDYTAAGILLGTGAGALTTWIRK